MKNIFESCDEAYDYFYKNLTLKEIANEVRAINDLDLIDAYEDADPEGYKKIIDDLVWDKIQKAEIKEE